MKKNRIISLIKNNPAFFVGAAMLLFLALVVLFGPVFCEHTPDFLYDEMLSPPSLQHPFGTDGVGADIFSMAIYGTRTTLRIGITVALISSLIGMTIGGISGYIGGVLDRILCEFLNVFMMLPSFFLIVLVISIYGNSINNIILVMALTNWIGSARLMRGQAMALKEKAFIKNAQVIGESSFHIIFTHIIPNCLFTEIINLTMIISGAIMSEAGLSFLGLGDPNIISWGKIIALGRKYLPKCWWICAFPGLAILFTSLAFYLLGDGINRLQDVKRKQMES